MRSGILFFSYNNHQRKYFHFLMEQLSNEFRVYHLHNSLGLLAQSFFQSKKKGWLDSEIEDIVRFSQIKFNVQYNIATSSIISRQHYIYLKGKVNRLGQYLKNYMISKRIDLVIVWNGNNLESALAGKLATKLGIKTLYMEIGPFPSTIQLDPFGVNASSSLANKDWEFYARVKPDETRLKELHKVGIKTREVRGGQNGYCWTEKEQLEIFSRKYIFLPFQVHTDTQVLVNSLNIKSMPELLEVCHQAVNKYNKKHRDDLWIVVKEHPSDVGRIDYSQLRSTYEGKNVTFVPPDYKIADLIANSQLVITLNSSVGIEALLYYKPVITLALAIYNVRGVAYHVPDPRFLSNAIEECLSMDVNRDMVDRFLFYFRYCYLLEGNRKNPTGDNNVAVLDRIKDVLLNQDSITSYEIKDPTISATL